MRIESIRIRGFGCLRQREYVFPRDKAVLVVEDNEAGKSTLAAAILAGLCGFPARRTAGELMKLSEVYRPWEGDDYAIEMAVEAEGRLWRVERDFARGGLTVREADTNRDVSGTFDSDLAQHFLRLPREDFARVAFVTGKEVGSFGDSPNLRARLAAAVEGSRTDSGTDAALLALASPRCAVPGRGPLLVENAVKQLTRELAEKRREIAQLEASLDAAGEQTTRLDRARADYGDLTARISGLDDEYAAARRAEAREGAKRLERLQSGASDLDREAREIESRLNETRQFAVASEGDPRELSAARLTLENAEEAINRAAAEAKTVERAGASGLGYALAAIGGAAFLACLGMMILGRLDAAASVIGALLGASVAAAGLVQITRSGGQRTALKARFEQAREMLDEARGQAAKRLSMFAVQCQPGADAGELLTRTAEALSRYLADRARLREIGNQLTKLKQEITETGGRIEQERKLVGSASAESDPDEPHRSADEVEADRRAVRAEHAAASDQVRDLERSVGALVDSYRCRYPELEEEERMLRRQLAKIERFGSATALAHGVLREVSEQSRRKWAVALNEQAGAILPRLNPCYDDIRFDDSLAFTIRQAETGRIIEKTEVDAGLSTGAKDQVYLAVRLAICRELSRLGESIPVILDDPLIAADDTRFESGMRYLVEELAKDQQVIVLSCHRGRHEALLRHPLLTHRIARIAV